MRQPEAIKGERVCRLMSCQAHEAELKLSPTGFWARYSKPGTRKRSSHDLNGTAGERLHERFAV